MAMRQMRQCYADASIVLVLDRHLQQSTSQASAAELLLHIGISDWRSRVWTLQEGFFARKLMFQFLETAVDAEELWDGYASSVSAAMISSVDLFIFQQVTPALGIELYERGKRKRQTKKFSLASLATSLRGRAISKPDDEPLCMASLLDQDQILGILLDSPKEDRMKAFWRSQPLIPSWVAFVDGPRLTEAGYQWALSSLRWPNLTIQSETSDYGTLLPDGLQITKSGFVLLNNELAEAGTSNRVIGLVDEMKSRHYVMCSLDKFNAPLPELHDDTPLAVVVLEWSKAYEPQVLVAVVLDEGPNIRCRGLVTRGALLFNTAAVILPALYGTLVKI
ncbi:hypothetical protein BJX63DRAFT_426755 [Aspergillus granulosus]|uniref:Heterokaryon incompatibility domain-containing protein n=1 Tax=Aspergillus granulosus TaxID=176169 RepID=A0ABR4I595_9EURO